MTRLQKDTLLLLLNGGSISAGSNGFRVRNGQHLVELKIKSSSFYTLKYLLRKTKAGLFVINKTEVRKLHGKNWVYQEYNKILKRNKVKEAHPKTGMPVA